MWLEWYKILNTLPVFCDNTEKTARVAKTLASGKRSAQAKTAFNKRQSDASAFPLTKGKSCARHNISIASPKEKNLYFSLTASLYTANISSRLHNAETSIIRVLSGKWKLVIRQSTALNL